MRGNSTKSLNDVLDQTAQVNDPVAECAEELVVTAAMNSCIS